MKLTFLTFFAILFACMSCFGQTNPCNERNDYWFGIMESLKGYNHDNHTGSSMNILNTGFTIVSKYDFTYNLYIGSTLILTKFVPKNTWEEYQDSSLYAAGSEKVEPKAFHIVTDQPVSITAFNLSDETKVYSTDSLGMEYYTMCYTPNFAKGTFQSYGFDSKNSEFLIVATVDNTLINITPSVTTDRGHSAGFMFPITLNQGEVYQVQSANLPTLDGQGDLTGSYIKSNNPVAVFSGSYSTSIPTGVCCYNHLYEQMPPVNKWGTKFITVPLLTRKKDYYRILASEDNTHVQIGDTTFITLNKTKFYEFTLSSAQLIKSDQPVLLAQFSASIDVDGAGEPFMVIVSPVDHTLEKVFWKELGESAYDYINITTNDEAAGLIKLNNIFIPKDSFKCLNGSGYSYVQLPLDYLDPVRTLESTLPGKGFTAIEYGLPYALSAPMPGMTRSESAFGINITYNQKEDNGLALDLGGKMDKMGIKSILLCAGAGPLTLDAGKGFSSYLWKSGETTQSITVSKEGIYSVTATTPQGCVLKDSVNIVISKPVVNLGPDLVVCDLKSVTLDADPNNGFSSYLWSTPQGPLTDQKITASQSGAYLVTATGKDGCTSTDTINVAIGARPKPDLQKLDTLICGQKSAILNISADKGSYTLQRQDNGFVYNGLQAIVPDWGTYPFKFTATDVSGCSADTTFKVSFHKIPKVDFSIDSTKCYHYNLDVKYIGDAVVNASKFTWVFGSDTIANGVGIDSYTIPLGVNKSKRDLSLRVIQDGCSNADTIKDIKVIPDLSMKVVDSLACQPFNAEFIATNTETVTYDWNFGDGTSKRLDNHPFYIYQNSGYYNVNLKVTSTKGCVNSVSADSIVHVAPIPTVGFSLDPAKCLDLSNHQISYFGTGNQKDSYQWDLSGFDAKEIIQNPGSTQGPFVFNLINKPQSSIGLQVISQYGCKSVNKNILVKRIPAFLMTFKNNIGCVPLETKFDGITGDNIDQVSYSWDFGDGTSATGESTSHLYGNAGNKYTIVLTASSSITGCSDTIMKVNLVNTYPNPQAAFSIDHPIVYNDKPEVKFENQSLGAVNYLWDFGDGTSSTEENPSRKFELMGYHQVLLESFNEYSCADTVSHQVLVATARIFPPNAFSPNAPNAIDREFRLFQETIKPDGYHLTILSRWNDIVFEARNEIKGWDGRMKNGDFAPAGNYLWVLDFTDFLDRTHRQTGTVTLVY
jgi:PKD repeat protein